MYQKIASINPLSNSHFAAQSQTLIFFICKWYRQQTNHHLVSPFAYLSAVADDIFERNGLQRYGKFFNYQNFWTKIFSYFFKSNLTSKIKPKNHLQNTVCFQHWNLRLKSGCKINAYLLNYQTFGGIFLVFMRNLC